MMDRLTSKANDPLWKQVGQEAVKQAVSTFVEEGVKAMVSLWKSRHMKELDIEFEEREKARKEEAGDTDPEAGASVYEW